MSVFAFLGLGLLIALGAFVQRIAGFGLAVVAAPVVVMVEPRVMPAALLLVVLPLPLLEIARHHDAVLWRPFGWAMAGRLATTPVGVWLVAHTSHDATALAVAGMVLVAVAGSLTRLRVRANASTSVIAGLLTGISATTASIGGPFFSLALQEQPPQRARSTLAPFFLLGSLTSLSGLALGGQVTHAALTAGLGWLPFTALGALAAQPVRQRIDPHLFKRVIFALATLSAFVVIGQVLAR